ncbi:MAG: hypothetical protein ABL904_15300 [Hyphomicrobiaceae bacterium]
MAVTKTSGNRIGGAWSDPHNLPEVFANSVVMRVRDGVVHLTMCTARPCGVDEKGIVKDELVVTARTVMSVPTLLSMFKSFQQIQQNMDAADASPSQPHSPQPSNIH